jgi:hypothetical protein
MISHVDENNENEAVWKSFFFVFVCKLRSRII